MILKHRGDNDKKFWLDDDFLDEMRIAARIRGVDCTDEIVIAILNDLKQKRTNLLHGSDGRLWIFDYGLSPT